jgi:hypothetical protein
VDTAESGGGREDENVNRNVIRIPDIEHDDDTCTRVHFDRKGNAYRCTLEPGHQGIDSEWCHHAGTGQYWHPDGTRVSKWSSRGLDQVSFRVGIVATILVTVMALGMLHNFGIWPF